MPDKPSLANLDLTCLVPFPNVWTKNRIKYCFTVVGGGTPSKDDETFWTGEIPWASPKDISSDRLKETEDHISKMALANSSVKLVPSGSLLMVVRSGILKHTLPTVISAIDTTLNQDMKGFIPTGQLQPEYFSYLIKGNQSLFLTLWRKQGATVDSLAFDDVLRTLIPVPPASFQRDVASFLQIETSRIDSLVAKKERQIELLQEKRQAIIAKAVTKGLYPNAKMKDSGIGWVGQIPIEWQTRKLNYCADFVSGSTPDKGNEDYWAGLNLWVSPKDMKRPIIADTEDRISDQAIIDSGMKTIEPESVLVVVRGMILAHSFPVALAGAALTINQDIKALLPRKVIEPRFLAYLLRGCERVIVSLFVDDSAHGTKAIRMENWKSFPLVIPPLPEQIEIARYLDSVCEASDNTISKVSSSIELLKEYRSSLITAAVSGKIDVSKFNNGAKPNAPL